MNIAARLLLSFMSIAVATSLGTAIFASWMVDELTRENMTATDNAVNALAEVNYDLSENILTRIGERMVDMKSAETAALLRAKLMGKDLSDYAALRKDPDLRSAAVQSIQTNYGTAGYTDLNDNQGFAVIHPNPQVEGRNYSEWKDTFPAMWNMVQQAARTPRVNGYYTFVDEKGRTRLKYMALTQVKGTPFIVSAVVNIDNFFTPIHDAIRVAQDKAALQGRTSVQHAAKAALTRSELQGALGLAVILVLASVAAVLMTRSIVGPIRILRDAVGSVGKGDFETQVPEAGPMEIRQLAASFNLLGGWLKEYMANYARVASQKERLESELSIASEIQMSLLPHTFTPFPNNPRLELHAIIQSARHVGGDFYDYFPLDDDRLFISIGDVCGKGAPAAILMAQTKSLLETAALGHAEPDQVLSHVNRRMAVDNDNCNFVTIFCGILNLASGELVFSNAGHNPPVMITAQGAQFLSVPEGPAVGFFEQSEFTASKITFSPGDALLAYTDGVTEAMNSQDAVFTEARLLSLMNSRSWESCRALTETTFGEVTAFEEGAEQADDITLLAVRWK